MADVSGGAKSTSVVVKAVGAFPNPDDAPMINVTTYAKGTDANGIVPIGWRGQVPITAFSSAWMNTDAKGKAALEKAK